MTEICDHPEFHADVAVGRIEDLGRFLAEVKVHCTKCGEPFRFLGLTPRSRWTVLSPAREVGHDALPSAETWTRA